MFVKICGITSAEALDAAVNAGADAVGFVFADSPRRISPARAAELAEAVPAGVARVAVMLHPTAVEWTAVRDVFRPDWLQTEAEDFAALDVPESMGRMPVYRDTADFDFDADTEWPEHILFEGGRSGVGMTPNWERAAMLARHTCLMLAGGLSAHNVQEAIIQVHPWGVDVSSGVESSPGVKDPEKIAAFIAAARTAEGAHGG